MAKKHESVLKVEAENLAEINAKMTALKNEKEVCEEKIKGAMKELGADKVETNVGTLTIYSRTTWKYSKDIENAYDDLKVREKDEQESGVAKAIMAESFRFTPVKVAK